MQHETFDELRASGRLPTPPGVGMAVLKITQREDFSTEDLSRAISADPALTGRLLQIANSATHAGVRPATTVADAAMRLGVRAVRNVALGFSLLSAHRTGACARFDYDRFWSASLARAVAARAISERLRVGVPAEAYILGLLADIGRLALASVHPEEYARILGDERARDPMAIAALERASFEIDHSETAALLMDDWGLPRPLREAVRIHESEERRVNATCADTANHAKLLAHASVLAEVCLAGDATAGTSWTRLAAGLDVVRDALGFDRAEFGAWCGRVAAEWTEWGRLLHVPTQKVKSLQEIHARAEEAMAAFAAPQASQRGERLRILAVDDDQLSLRLLQRELVRAGHEVLIARDGAEALAMALESWPHIVIADWMMPEMDGLELCRSLRRIPDGQGIYFLLLTGRDEEERVIEAFDSGVDDFVVKPFNPRILRARLRCGERLFQKREQEEQRTRNETRSRVQSGRRMRDANRRANTDELTGLYNRRWAMEELRREWDKALELDEPLSVLVVDADGFKKVNDQHGHDVGDVVLKELAATLSGTARADEEVARWGGEEFLVICRNATAEQAAICAERLRAAVAQHRIRSGTFDACMTISVGVAQADSSMATFDALLKRADDAVYAAKAAGRDRVAVDKPRDDRARESA